MQRNTYHSIASNALLSPGSSQESSTLLPNFTDHEKEWKGNTHGNNVFRGSSASCNKLVKRTCCWILGLGVVISMVWLVMHHAFQFHICDGRCFFITWKYLESTPFTLANLDFPCHVPPYAFTPSTKSFHLHQSWKTSQLPSKFETWSASWKVHHPNWTYHLWTDEGNRAFIQEKYPWFLRFYDAYPKHIMRVDAVRYLYLHAYGGIYADLDMEALKPLDAMIQAPIVLGWLTHANHGHALPNAFMAASEPGHPFWLLLLAKSIENQWLYAGVEQVTGPHMLTEMVLHYVDQCKKVTSISSTFQTKKNEQTTPPSTTKMMMMENKEVNRDEIQFVGDLQLLPTGMIYPYSWIHPGNHHSVCSATSHEFNATECKARFPNAFTITYWTHSWGHKNILLQD